MTDDIRTRIIALLYAMDCDDYDIQAGEELDPSVFWAIREGAERRADAVIRELGLARELGVRTKSGGPVFAVVRNRSEWGDLEKLAAEETVHRYTTEWIADE